MRVAQITYTYRPVRGGADAYADALHLLLKRRGHPHLVYQRREALSDPDLRFVPNPLRGWPGEFWSHALSLPLCYPSRARHEVLIAHYPPYLLAAAGARLLGRPAFATAAAGKPALIGLSHGVTWDDRPGTARSAIKRGMARLAFRLADAFVANDSFFLREMGLSVAPRERMFEEIAPGRWFIPNCVDAERFRRTDGLPNLKRLRPIIVPRNLYFNRGVHLAIAAFAEFARDEPDATLVIVGATGQRGYTRRLRRQAAASPVRERVIFWGGVAHAAMPEVYSSAELTLIPSLCGEGTSISALESMATGTAVISTDAGGLPDLPTHRCRPDAASLAHAMREVWPGRARVAAEQQAEVRRTYTMANWQAAWTRAIESAAGRAL